MAVRGKTRKTKEAQTAAAERKGLCSSSPAVLREANHGRGFVSPFLCYGDLRLTSGSPGSVIYQRSDRSAFQHSARTSWHSSKLAPESPAPPLHRVTAQPGRFSTNTAGPARCWARTWICSSFIFFS